jgi:glycosyltransferase involved in cell wall biosynthesis
MRVLIVTQSVDRNNPILGFFHRWIEEFSKNFKEVIVICLEKGEYDLPKNVKVLSLGKEKNKSKIEYLKNFYKFIWNERKNYSVVFVHMNQEYVLLGSLLWKLLGKKITMWRNHKEGSFFTNIAVALSEHVFCTSPFSYTAKFEKASLMPIGVDTNEFKIGESENKDKNSILFFGRIAPVKKVDIIVDALSILSKENISFNASIYGDALPKDSLYYNSLVKKVEVSDLSRQVTFYKGVPHLEAPSIYGSHGIFINITQDGSFDKTIAEAMACGSAVLTSNKALKDDIQPDYFIENVVASEIAEKLKRLLLDSKLLDTHMREYVVENHSLKSLVEKYKEIISK